MLGMYGLRGKAMAAIDAFYEESSKCGESCWYSEQLFLSDFFFLR